MPIGRHGDPIVPNSHFPPPTNLCLLYAMEGTKRRQPLPLCDGNTLLPNDLQMKALLATVFHERIGRTLSLHHPPDLYDSIDTAISTLAIPDDLAQLFTPGEMTRTLSFLNPGMSVGPDSVPYEFFLELTPQL